MSTVEHFKSYVALVIEKVALDQLLEEALDKGEATSNLQARYRRMCDEADRMLMNWFTAPDDLVTVFEEMRTDYELAFTGSPSEQEQRLAICRYEVALRCLQFVIPDFSDEDCEDDPAQQALCLLQRNAEVLCKIDKYVRCGYLGYEKA